MSSISLKLLLLVLTWLVLLKCRSKRSEPSASLRKNFSQPSGSAGDYLPSSRACRDTVPIRATRFISDMLLRARGG